MEAPDQLTRRRRSKTRYDPFPRIVLEHGQPENLAPAAVTYDRRCQRRGLGFVLTAKSTRCLVTASTAKADLHSSPAQAFVPLIAVDVDVGVAPWRAESHPCHSCPLRGFPFDTKDTSTHSTTSVYANTTGGAPPSDAASARTGTHAECSGHVYIDPAINGDIAASPRHWCACVTPAPGAPTAGQCLHRHLGNGPQLPANGLHRTVSRGGCSRQR